MAVETELGSPRIGVYSFDDGLIEAALRDHSPQLRVYRLSELIVVLGRSSKIEKEINLDACLQDGVPILRRRGGGCSVVQDAGNVIVSVAIPAKGIGDIRRYFDILTGMLIDALESAGVHDARREGFSDLAIGDRKVAGSCMHRKRDALYFSASILVDPDVELMERYLKHPPREPKYRRGRSHRDFVGTLRDLSGARDIETVADQIRNSLAESLQLLPA